MPCGGGGSEEIRDATHDDAENHESAMENLKPFSP